jgi:SecDF, P1 head subdomain
MNAFCLALLAVLPLPDFEKGLRVDFGTQLHITVGSQREGRKQVESILRQRLGPHARTAEVWLEKTDDYVHVSLPFFEGMDVLSSWNLASGAAIDAQTFALDGEAEAPGSGWLHVEGEVLEILGRELPRSLRVRRGSSNTQAASHAAGAKVLLVSYDSTALLVGARGELEFLEEAPLEASARDRGSFAEERQRFLDWWKASGPDAEIEDFAQLDRKQGGPPEGWAWCVAWRQPHAVPESWHALVPPAKRSWRFTRDDVAEWKESVDALGFPALGFTIRKERAADFAAWTASLEGKRMAVVLDRRSVLSLATVLSALPGEGTMSSSGRAFRAEEVRALLAVLRAPVLPWRSRFASWSCRN